MDTQKLNKFYLLASMDLIQKEESFRDDFLKIANSIYADVISYSTNPNCSCKSKVSKFILDNAEIVKSLLLTWDNNNPGKINLELIEENYFKKVEETSYIGKVITINKDFQEYENLIKTIAPLNSKPSFRGFNLIESEDKWTLFFY